MSATLLPLGATARPKRAMSSGAAATFPHVHPLRQLVSQRSAKPYSDQSQRFRTTTAYLGEATDATARTRSC